MFKSGLKGINLLDLSVTYKMQKLYSTLQKSSSRLLIRYIRVYEEEKLVKNYKKDMKSDDNYKLEVIDGLSDKLIKWALQNKISYFAFSKLLKVLSECGIEHLPENARTLLNAKEKEIKVRTVPPGVYTHFGLKKNLTKVISNLMEKNLFSQTHIDVSVFIDELPLVKFTRKRLWVILGSVVGFTNIVFFIGAYNGFCKPKDPNLFLSEFVEEAKRLSQNGLEINNEVYKFKIKRLICDAPAKAFILNIRDFKSYSSCTKCKTVGEYKNNKICFLDKGIPRKDEDFEGDEIYLTAKTNLLEIPHFGVVSNVILDYMHLVCLGVVKKLLSVWLTDETHWRSVENVSDIFKNLSRMYPCEFETKPKSFKIFTRWTANEFREFLLYYGPVVLKNNLKQEFYDHFLLLHFACRLLCMEASPENVICGRTLLNRFVENYKGLYKKEQITHNIHGLYHLADECSAHGTLDTFSAFSFEKFLVQLRNAMRNLRKHSIPQIVIKESYDKVFAKAVANLAQDEYKPLKKLKISEETPFQHFMHFEKLSNNSFTIVPSAVGDCYVLLKNNKIIQVTNVLGKKEKSNKTFFIAGEEFSCVSSFYSDPFHSSKQKIFKVGKGSGTVDMWPTHMIDKKCMRISLGDESVMIALLDENF